jgi:hypothetical protein
MLQTIHTTLFKTASRRLLSTTAMSTEAITLYSAKVSF